MNLSSLRRISYLPLAMLLVAGTLSAAPPASESATVFTDAALSALERQASESLQKTRDLAVRLQRDAEVLDSIARAGQLGWESHAVYLNQAKEHVNNMGEHLNWLRDMRHGVAHWQRQAIDRLFPAALDLANSTQAALIYLGENRDRARLRDRDYRGHVSTIADRAGEVKTTAGDFLKLAETQNELSRLELKLEASAS